MTKRQMIGELLTDGQPRGEATFIANNSLPETGLRFLVAEKDAVNQRMALRALNKLGHQADCVTTGRDVLAAVDAMLYDVILMDCNLPEMDGYEATRRIRARTDRSQPHIIAMATNALLSDREKCLAAGMDDYLSKPLREQDLSKTLLLATHRRLNGTAPPDQGNPGPQTESLMKPSTASSAVRVDPTAIDRLRELGEPGGPDLATELIDLYLSDGRAMLEKVRESQTAGDRNLLKRHAHTLKGSSRNMGAETVAAIAKELELTAEQGDQGRHALLVGQLTAAFEATVPLLAAQKQPGTSA